VGINTRAAQPRTGAARILETLLDLETRPCAQALAFDLNVRNVLRAVSYKGNLRIHSLDRYARIFIAQPRPRTRKKCLSALLEF
jgi:hypothetical protein